MPDEAALVYQTVLHPGTTPSRLRVRICHTAVIYQTKLTYQGVKTYPRALITYHSLNTHRHNRD